jgi:HD-GYP domain-containing protein (c-di-GMP phosphodiesterase class II)
MLRISARIAVQPICPDLDPRLPVPRGVPAALPTLSLVRSPVVEVAVSDVLAGLSRALDITEGHPQGHAIRTCLIGLRIAAALDLDETQTLDLFYALLLKDAGCSSNAARVHQLFGGNDLKAKRAVWLRDWRRLPQKIAYAVGYAGRGEGVGGRLRRMGGLALAGPGAEHELFQVRCDRGAAIALDFGLSPATASAILTMDEHWDGGGQPQGLCREQIPILGRIIGLAQVLEIFAHEVGHVAALDVVRRRAGRWFDPIVVRAADTLGGDSRFWLALKNTDAATLLAAAGPREAALIVTEERLERIAEGFASIIDAKSPYTCDHSRRVAGLATEIGRVLGFGAATQTRLRRAGLLHDIGKLGVPNSILDKPGRLTADEWAIVRRHPADTFSILDAVPMFRDFAFDASCHHEKLDGSGYHAGRRADALTPPARVLAVADICDALLAERPYRRGLPPDEVISVLTRECEDGKLCPLAARGARAVLEAR